MSNYKLTKRRMFFVKSRYKEVPTFYYNLELVNVLILVHVAVLVFISTYKQKRQGLTHALWTGVGRCS